MTPAGKIINIDSFKKKESGLSSPGSSHADAQRDRRRRIAWVSALSAMVIASLTYLMIPERKDTVVVYPEGSIAPRNIKAPEEMLVEDVESTDKNRRKAREAVQDVYDFDPQAQDQAPASIKKAFALVGKGYALVVGPEHNRTIAEFERSWAKESGVVEPAEELELSLADAKKALDEFEQSETFTTLEKEFDEGFGISLDEKSLKTLRYYHYWPRIGELAAELLDQALKDGIVSRNVKATPSAANGIVIRDIISGSEREVRNYDTLFTLTEAKKLMKKKVEAIVTGDDRPALRRLIVNLAALIAQPNITFNQKETRALQDKAAEAVMPVFFRVQRDEMIVREGERMTAAHVAKLKFLAGKAESVDKAGEIAGALLFNIMLIAMAIAFTAKYHEEISDFPKMQNLAAALLVSHMALIWASGNISSLFFQQSAGISLAALLLAAPLAFGPMIVSIFFTTELTVLFTIVVSALTGLMFRDYPILAMLTLTGGMVCAYHVRYYSKRTAVIKVGLIVSVINVLVVLAFDLAGGKLVLHGDLTGIGFAFLGGAMAALFVSGALPLFESLFPVVSDIKLMELTNQNHPLLRKMMMEAPGTYHHSMMVGALAEESCKSIGANALLAKAGAMFHDIGKINKRDYFVENQLQIGNPHDKLSPSMSALIVINHIKAGLELAKKHKLLPQIAAMIPEHHGTQLVKVFYYKAKEAEDANRDEVREADFRYPGPIPSSRESACVALADSIEAAARASVDPTPQKLKELVTEVINDKFRQGQLDNSHLTLHELALITDSFTHVLSGIHHQRMPYPEEDKEQDDKNAGPRPQAEPRRDAEGL